jgi:hypothetical protein
MLSNYYKYLIRDIHLHVTRVQNCKSATLNTPEFIDHAVKVCC